MHRSLIEDINEVLMLCLSRCLHGGKRTLDMLWTHRIHLKQCLLLCVLLALLVTLVLLFMWTPVLIYILDRLSMRAWFMPTLSCNNCTNFNFKYLINNQSACSGQDVFLLNVIISHPAHVVARRTIRQTWGAVRSYKGRQLKTMFAFGTHPDKNLNHQMHLENDLYHDVIQGDFRDEYTTLTNKSLMILDWFTKYCSNARFLLKTDDDSFNHPQRWIDYLLHIHQRLFVGGYCFTVLPDRRHTSKYYVAPATFPDVYYPTYCTGPGYVLSQAAAVAIYKVSPNVRYVPMEDVFIGGMCRMVAGLTYTQIPGVVVGGNQLEKCDLATWTKNTHNTVPKRMKEIWTRALTADRRDCFDRDLRKFLILLVLASIWIKHLISLHRPGA